jgi:hypothetical protein
MRRGRFERSHQLDFPQPGPLDSPKRSQEKNMKPAFFPPKHEVVLKQLRYERAAEDQRLSKLQLKIVERMSKEQEMRAS